MPLLNSMGNMRNMTMFNSTIPSAFTNYLDVLSNSGSGSTSLSTFPCGRFTSTGESFVSGYIPGAAYLNEYGMLLKTDAYGYILNQIQLQCTTSNGQYYVYPRSITVDSSNNVYMVGTFSENGLLNKSFIVKFDSNLNILWQRQYYTGTGWSGGFYDVIVNENSGTVYACGYIDFSYTNSAPIVIKYNSSTGSLISQRKTSTTTTVLKGTQITSDSSSNYYVGGFVQNGTGIVITKFNSSDTFQWSINSSLAVFNYLMATDTSGNTYFAANDQTYVNIMKISSSGSIVWQKRTRLDPSSTGGNGKLAGLTVDTSGNVYLFVGIYVPLDNRNYTVLLKMNSGGTVLWQNRIQGPLGSIIENLFNSQISWRGNKLWVSFGYSFPQTYNFSLPDDGSLTGTFTNYTYLPTTLVSFTATSLTISTLVNTSATISYTDAAGVVYLASGTTTQIVTPI